MEDESATVIKKKYSAAAVIRVQSFIRGWLDRKKVRKNRMVLFDGRIKKSSVYVQFRLVKYGHKDYQLSAKV